MSNIIVINPFEIPQGMEAEALASWETFAAYFREQPGYVSTKLHRAVNPDARFHLVNVAEWESPEAFEAALNNPALQEVAAKLEHDFPHYPGLYEIVRC